MFNFFNRGRVGTTNDLLPSPTDNRDHALSSYMPSVKRYPKEKPCPFDLKVHNQLFSPSCVGWSCSAIKEGNERLEKEKIIFDGEWIYDECKKIDGYDGPGTYFRTGLSVLKDTGAMPIDGGEPGKYRIKSYARVDDMSFEGVKKALSIYHFLLAGFRGTNEGWKNEVIRSPKEGEAVWGHATCLIGYDEKYIIGQNSWGDYSWVHGGSGGYFKVPADYLPFEAWAVLLDAPNEIETVGDKIVGYIASEFTTTKNGQRITTANLNIRKEPKIGNNIVSVLPKGSVVKTTGEITFADNWNWIPLLG